MTVSSWGAFQWIPSVVWNFFMAIQNTHNRQTSMPPVWLEPTISAGERPQTYALDRAATGTGIITNTYSKFIVAKLFTPQMKCCYCKVRKYLSYMSLNIHYGDGSLGRIWGEKKKTYSKYVYGFYTMNPLAKKWMNFELYVLLTVRPGMTPSIWPTWCTIT